MIHRFAILLISLTAGAGEIDLRGPSPWPTGVHRFNHNGLGTDILLIQ